MFDRLYSETGLSLERLRPLVEVAAHGSIVKAANADPVRQSLYSRQIKELEDFFQVTLFERQGRGIKLTNQGRELARISRFFMLGLANFQRGCLAEGQSYRIGSDATFNHCFLVPLLAAGGGGKQRNVRFSVEVVSGDEIERRLHDLTLDFGVVKSPELSRPLQSKELGRGELDLWVPKSLAATVVEVERMVAQKRLPLVWPGAELDIQILRLPRDYEPALSCGGFLETREAMCSGRLAGLLPRFLEPPAAPGGFLKFSPKTSEPVELAYRLAWNPRLLRLNPHATGRRDALAKALTEALLRSGA